MLYTVCALLLASSASALVVGGRMPHSGVRVTMQSSQNFDAYQAAANAQQYASPENQFRHSTGRRAAVPLGGYGHQLHAPAEEQAPPQAAAKYDEAESADGSSIFDGAVANSQDRFRNEGSNFRYGTGRYSPVPLGGL